MTTLLEKLRASLNDCVLCCGDEVDPGGAAANDIAGWAAMHGVTPEGLNDEEKEQLAEAYRRQAYLSPVPAWAVKS